MLAKRVLDPRSTLEKKHIILISPKHEPAIGLRNAGRWISYFDRCLTDHNMVITSNFKNTRCNQDCLTWYKLENGRHVAWRRVAWVSISLHEIILFLSIVMGTRFAALGVAGAPL